MILCTNEFLYGKIFIYQYRPPDCSPPPESGSSYAAFKSIVYSLIMERIIDNENKS